MSDIFGTVLDSDSGIFSVGSLNGSYLTEMIRDQFGHLDFAIEVTNGNGEAITGISSGVFFNPSHARGYVVPGFSVIGFPSPGTSAPATVSFATPNSVFSFDYPDLLLPGQSTVVLIFLISASRPLT